MIEVINFFAKHWILCSLFVALFSFYLAVELIWSKEADLLSPQAVVAMMNHNKAVILDIRKNDAFAEGHILNAINIPEEQLNDDKKLQKYKNKPIILVSYTGKFSSKIIGELQKKEFTQVLQLAGGMHEWSTQGLPVVSSKDKGK